jgi:hypothetical protein
MDVSQIKDCITNYFRANNLLSQRLPQAYILFKALQKTGQHPSLIMGFLVNHTLSLYYIHYWVELNDQVHDIVGETYNQIAYKLSSEAEVMHSLSIHILDTYLNMDSVAIEKRRVDSFTKCNNGMFFDDLYEITSPDVYHKIQMIYNKLLN